MKLYHETAAERTPREKDILFADWSEDRQSATPRPLRTWLDRYPQYAPDLIAWAADMPLLECALESSAPDPAGEAQTLAIGRQVLAEMRANYFATTDAAAIPSAPIADLLATARAQGLTAKTLAARVGVGLPLVAKLQQRLVRLATIPEELLTRLANTLHTSVEEVRAYLDRPSTLAMGASYKSDGVPQASQAEDFAEAVRVCTDMTDDQKRFWLNQK